jgi:hypothetical protein
MCFALLGQGRMEYILNHLDEGIAKAELNRSQSVSYENMCGANSVWQLREALCRQFVLKTQAMQR